MLSSLVGRGKPCLSPPGHGQRLSHSQSRPIVTSPLFRHQLASRCNGTLPQPPAAASPLGGAADAEGAGVGRDYKPFSRMKEGDPYKLLGLGKDAQFEEVQNARNYLYEQYKHHEPSREAIELAFESILKEHYRTRQKVGFKPPRTGRRGEAIADVKPTLGKRIAEVVDLNVSLTKLINEGIFFAGFALWALFSTDVSFPIILSVFYSVWLFQDKRTKADPEGPYFGGNVVVGAILSTFVNIALACGVAAAVTTPFASILAASFNQAVVTITILVAGVLAVYVK